MFEDLLAAQDGVLTRDQAEAHGVGKQAINRLIRSGRWERRGPNVYFACDRPFTDRARIRCAV
ncbi:type IV toxin-antitoxin system AbiEi family antitoxin domain-containing protein [Rhodococcoides trifolii]|uniref:type IV toxin-antitoxin system AbiEi family antitoxin domain-containing protein n=1 Tax=Rhodococcoides trifolii TaxID=908250 RepID=UPI0028118E96|nr:type IV toxin-antitoxin system AbiEi family antitoxin domain-containing protein [Rhodococcus trifolii]